MRRAIPVAIVSPMSGWTISSKPHQNNQPQASGCAMLYCVCTGGMKPISWIYTIYNNVAHSSQRKIPRCGRANWCFCAKPQKHFSAITGFIHSTRHYWHINPPRHLWLGSLIHSVKCGRAAPGTSICCSFNKTEKSFTRPSQSHICSNLWICWKSFMKTKKNNLIRAQSKTSPQALEIISMGGKPSSQWLMEKQDNYTTCRRWNSTKKSSNPRKWA